MEKKTYMIDKQTKKPKMEKGKMGKGERMDIKEDKTEGYIDERKRTT